MCSHYQALKDRAKFEKAFNVKLPPYEGVYDVWPMYQALFVRRPLEADVGDDAVPEREALPGMFGLIPPWAKDDKFARRTFNARSEIAATLPSFRDAWRKGQKCIIPADAIYEPDWGSGKAQAMRIQRSDGEAMGLAGLWSVWKSPAGARVASFTMLTINADEHALMRNYHKPADEKRMVVILPEASYSDWLTAPPSQNMDFLRQYPADRMVAGKVGGAKVWRVVGLETTPYPTQRKNSPFENNQIQSSGKGVYQTQSGGTKGGTNRLLIFKNLAFMRVLSHLSIDPSSTRPHDKGRQVVIPGGLFL